MKVSELLGNATKDLPESDFVQKHVAQCCSQAGVPHDCDVNDLNERHLDVLIESLAETREAMQMERR